MFPLFHVHSIHSVISWFWNHWFLWMATIICNWNSFLSPWNIHHGMEEGREVSLACSMMTKHNPVFELNCFHILEHQITGCTHCIQDEESHYVNLSWCHERWLAEGEVSMWFWSKWVVFSQRFPSRSHACIWLSLAWYLLEVKLAWLWTHLESNNSI